MEPSSGWNEGGFPVEVLGIYHRPDTLSTARDEFHIDFSELIADEQKRKDSSHAQSNLLEKCLKFGASYVNFIPLSDFAFALRERNVSAAWRRWFKV